MNKKELVDLLYKAIAYINGDNIKPADRIAANSFYYVEPTEESGYSRCYINIIKPEDTDNKFRYCSKITICGEIYMSKDVREQAEWLLGLFERASRITPISELKFHDKWNEATKIIKQIQEL